MAANPVPRAQPPAVRLPRLRRHPRGALPPRVHRGDGSPAGRGRRDHRRPRAADVREHDRRSGALRRRPAPRLGLHFAERHDLPTYHPDVRVFDVADEDGPLGLFVADLYASDSKRGGAWMNSFVTQSHLLGTRPVVLNTLNIPKPADGEPTLLTLDLVRTLFHEFGHAVHGLFSDEWFTEHGGLRRENGERFRRELLSRGGSVDPMQAYVAFRGRAPDVTPLLVRRGLQG